MGYNPDLKLAFEYNGSQHAKFHAMHRGDAAAFEDQQERDRLKAELCEKNGVALVVVPHTIKWGKLEGFIRDQLRRLGFL